MTLSRKVIWKQGHVVPCWYHHWEGPCRGAPLPLIMAQNIPYFSSAHAAYMNILNTGNEIQFFMMCCCLVGQLVPEASRRAPNDWRYFFFPPCSDMPTCNGTRKRSSCAGLLPSRSIFKRASRGRIKQQWSVNAFMIWKTCESCKDASL